MIEFDSNGRWHGKGVLPGPLKERAFDSRWLKDFIHEIREAGIHYAKALGNDGRFLGMEKIGVVEQLEDILSGFFWWYRNVLDGKPDSFQASNGRYGVQFEGYTWLANGTADAADFGTGGFRDWFNKKLLPLAAALITTYGEAAVDGVVGIDELAPICNLLDDGVNETLGAMCALKWGGPDD